ncbi:MAG TPA: ABC transporter permease subunit [Acidimicrobiales bacterium]|nr:ABC transporter permease subunit [Acidimicrobiales bacterium]
MLGRGPQGGDLSQPPAVAVEAVRPAVLRPGAPGGGSRLPAGRPGGARRRRLWALVVVVAFVASLIRSGVGRGQVTNAAGWSQVRAFLAAATDPVLDAEFLRLTAEATLTTVAYAVLGTALATLIGVVGGVLASESFWSPTRSRRPGRPGRSVRALGGWLGARAVLGLPRGVHEAVWALVLVSILGLDPLVAVLGIGIPYGAVTAKVYSELLDEAPHQSFAALRSAGVGRLAALAYSVVPLAFPDMLAYAFYRFECAIRGAAILGTIGAGGLGFQLALSFQSLRYREMWTLIYALVVVCGLADWWSTSLRRPSRLPAARSEPALVAEATPGTHRLGLRRDRRLLLSAVAAPVLVGISVVHLQVDLSTLWSPRAQGLAADLAGSALPPDLGAQTLATLGRLSLETLAMSVIAAVLASVGGMALAFLAASTFIRPDRGVTAHDGRRPRHWGRAAAALLTRAVLLVCRAIPPPVGALILVFVFIPGPLPGALALAVYNLGILGRLMAEVVENLDPRPVRGLRAQGAPGLQAFLYGTVPRALPRFAAYGLYRWEVTIRETVVVGLVGAGGLGTLLALQLAAFDYQGVLATLLALVALTLVVDLLGAGLRRALR